MYEFPSLLTDAQHESHVANISQMITYYHICYKSHENKNGRNRWRKWDGVSFMTFKNDYDFDISHISWKWHITKQIDQWTWREPIINRFFSNQNGWKLKESIKHNLTISCVSNKHRILRANDDKISRSHQKL